MSSRAQAKMQRLNKQLVKDLIEKQGRICDLDAQILSNLRKAEVREPTSADELSESGGEAADQDASEHKKEVSDQRWTTRALHSRQAWMGR